MKLVKALNEVTNEILWNLEYISNDIKTRIKKKPGEPNFGLKNIVYRVETAYFPYKRKNKLPGRRYAVLIEFHQKAKPEQMKEAIALIKDTHAEMFKEYQFKIEHNNRILKIMMDEDIMLDFNYLEKDLKFRLDKGSPMKKAISSVRAEHAGKEHHLYIEFRPKVTNAKIKQYIEKIKETYNQVFRAGDYQGTLLGKTFKITFHE